MSGTARGSLTNVDDALLHAFALPAPAVEGDKEARGRVLVIGGSRELPGAAILAATAALRAGAGKLVIATSASVAPVVGAAVPEARVIGLDETAAGGIDAAAIARLDARVLAANAVLVGPGMQDDDATCAFVEALAARLENRPLVLDAGALGAAERIVAHALPTIVTPHAGEMAHMTGIDAELVRAEPLRHARDAAVRFQSVVVLKGRTTYIAAPDGREWRHDGGNVGLAISGSGDVLAGIVAGLVSRGAALEQAAFWAVALHARAGERLAAETGTLGYLPRELAAELPALMESLSR